MNRLLTGLLTLALAFALTACGRAEPTPTPEPVEPPTATPTSEPTATPEPPEPPSAPSTLLEIATAAGNFTTLLSAIEAADLNEKLNSEGPYTIFAPTDLAFAALPEGSLGEEDAVYDLLLYHVVEGKLMDADLADGDILVTLLGDELPVTVQGEDVAVGGTPIVLADIEATNGVIHVLESVLTPPSQAAAGAADAASEAAAPVEGAAAAVEDAAETVEGAAAGAVAAAEGAAQAAQERAAGAQDQAAAAVEGAAAAVEDAAETVEGAAAGAVAAAEGAAQAAQERAAGAQDQAAAAVEGAAAAVEGAAAGAVAAAEGAAQTARERAAGAQDQAAAAVEGAVAAVGGAAETVEGAAAGAGAAAEGAAQTARERVAGAQDQAAAAVEGAAAAVEGAAAGAVAAAGGAVQAARERAAGAIQPFRFEGPSIADVAGENEEFAVLLAAVQAAGLTDTLQSEGPFTIFAPTQIGFGALPQSVLEGLLREPAGALQALLLYHVVPGVVGPDELAALDGQTLETAGGSSLTVTVDEAGVIAVDGVAVSPEPVEAGNGLIYSIDGVLIPVTE